MSASLKKYGLFAIIALLAFAAYSWMQQQNSGYGDAFASGNGRLEATEVDIATKLAGRVDSILVKEGEMVKTGQVLARMQVTSLEAQRNEARAMLMQTQQSVATADAQVAMSESDMAAARAVVLQRESERDAAAKRLKRSEALAREGNISHQTVDDERSALNSAIAAVSAAKAQVKAAESAVVAATAQAEGARTAVTAAAATLARIEADLADAELKAPRDGRIQYRVAQPGEVVAAGGKIVNLVDLTDVTMNFFLPEAAAGRLKLGSDVRLILDAAPDLVIPASVSFVASTAQFTPKTVETASERQKLMFKVKARIDPALLRQHQSVVKTGIPGIAWIKLDDSIDWPEALHIKVPQ